MTNQTISREQAELLATWIKANAKAPGWLDGYALGASYIDTRVRSGAKRDGRQAYVDIDHETARKVPQFRGMRRYEVEEFLNKEFPDLMRRAF